jgi:hypothetical protein
MHHVHFTLRRSLYLRIDVACQNASTTYGAASTLESQSRAAHRYLQPRPGLARGVPRRTLVTCMAWQCVDLGGRAGAVDRTRHFDRTRMQQVYYQPANCLCQARGRSAGEASPRAPPAGWITDRSPRYARVYKYSVLHYAVRRGGDARGRSTDRFTHAGWDLGSGGDGWLPGMGGGTGGGGGRAAARTSRCSRGPVVCLPALRT